LDARLGQVSAELRELVAADRTFHVEGRKGLSERVDARLTNLSDFILEIDQKLTKALSRIMDASGAHMKKVALTQQQNTEALVLQQKEETEAHLQDLSSAQTLALRALERRIHNETKELGGKIARALDGMDLLSSHITTKQNALEVQLSKVMKTVILV
jgi:hypothetical protein